jgi:hypothetical protein
VAWIESHAELRDHPKTDLLMELLGLTRRDAVGLIHFVWWRALTYAPTGDLTPFTDGQVARWADWEGNPADLIAGLHMAGFLDAGRQLHDWQEYAGRWIDRREANATRKREARAARANRTSPGHPPDVPPKSGATGPNRTLTGPNRTGPLPQTPSASRRKGPTSSLPLADSPGHETMVLATPAPSHAPTNGAGRIKPVLNGRNGWAGCPDGCPTNHGGPLAAKGLGGDWLALPADQRPAWREFVARHGRADLAETPAPTPAAQEA